MFAIMQQWADDSGTALNSRSRNIIIIVVCVFISTVLLNVIFIEIMVKRTLREKYEIFRLMH
jgi:type IV secretory pathway component VirB8